MARRAYGTSFYYIPWLWEINMWTIFIHATYLKFSSLGASSGIGLPNQYGLVFVGADAAVAKNVFINSVNENISEYNYISGYDLNVLWDNLAKLLNNILAGTSLAEIMIRPDITFINIPAIPISNRNNGVSCVCCGFVNEYIDPDMDPQTYKCYKCKSGW